jgi:hypothetical protein
MRGAARFVDQEDVHLLVKGLQLVSHIEQIYHLKGGLRFCFLEGSLDILVWPLEANCSIKVNCDSLDKREQAISLIVDDIIGIEESTTRNGRNIVLRWQVYPHFSNTITISNSASLYWASLANCAFRCHDSKMEQISSAISFSVIAMERHLMDISNNYHHELTHALERGFGQDHRFADIGTYDLWLSIHSFLLAAATTRDYLAQALANFVFIEDIAPNKIERIDTFRRLVEDGKKSGYLMKHHFGRKLLLLADESREESWLSRLSRYRNIVVHQSSINSFSGAKYLQLKYDTNIGEYKNTCSKCHFLLIRGRPLDRPKVTLYL